MTPIPSSPAEQKDIVALAKELQADLKADNQTNFLPKYIRNFPDIASALIERDEKLMIAVAALEVLEKKETPPAMVQEIVKAALSYIRHLSSHHLLP